METNLTAELFRNTAKAKVVQGNANVADLRTEAEILRRIEDCEDGAELVLESAYREAFFGGHIYAFSLPPDDDRVTQAIVAAIQRRGFTVEAIPRVDYCTSLIIRW